MSRPLQVLFIFLTVAAVSSRCANAQWLQLDLPQCNTPPPIVANGPNVYIGGSGSMFLSADNGINWVQHNFPGWDSVYAIAASGTHIYIGHYRTGVRISNDNGATWVESGLSSGSWYSLLVNGNSVMAGGSGTILKSTDGGANWLRADGGISSQLVRALAVSGTILYAGSDGGGVFRSTDSGANWTALNAGLLNTSVWAILINGDKVFAGTNGGGVSLSTNGGITWTQVNSGLTNLSVYSLTTSRNHLFAGTADGVFVSPDTGKSWTKVGLAGLSIYSLAASDEFLLAGVDWRVFRRSLSETTKHITSLVVADSLTSGMPFRISWSAGLVSSLNIQYTINNGTTWQPIANGVDAGLGEVDWMVPVVAPASSQCKFRFTSGSDPAFTTDSKLFTISAKVGTPLISLASGDYDTPQQVTLSVTPGDAQIYYSLNGNDPTTGSLRYSVPILIDSNQTLKVKAFKQDWLESDIASSTYRIAGQQISVYFNTPDLWLDADFNARESRTISPSINISYGYIASYQWSLNGEILGNTKDITIQLPTGTWYPQMTMFTDRGIVKKESVRISVYAANATTMGPVESGVSQLNGDVYFVTSKGGNVYCIDSTGGVTWTIQTGGAIQSTTCVSSQDNIYVGSSDTRLYSFDYQGIPRWDKAMGGTIVASPSTGSDGLIRVGISTGRAFALNESGTVMWSVQTGGAVTSSAAIDGTGNSYFGSNDAKLYAVSPTGSVLWTYTTGGAVRTSPALGADSSVVFGSNDGNIYKLDRTGHLVWSYATGAPVASSPIIGLNGTIYNGSSNGKFYALTSSGNELWQYVAGSPINATASLGMDGTLYFGTVSGDICALDGSGRIKWKLETGHPIVAPMLVTYSGLAMVGDTLGTVYIMKVPEAVSLGKGNGRTASNQIRGSGAFEWWTFKGNNQRTGVSRSIATSVKESPKPVPASFVLFQNYPNPFNPSTTIGYALPQRSHVNLGVYNTLGQQVATLINGEVEPGFHDVEFDAAGLASGVYFYRLQAGDLVQARKLLLLK